MQKICEIIVTYLFFTSSFLLQTSTGIFFPEACCLLNYQSFASDDVFIHHAFGTIFSFRIPLYFFNFIKYNYHTEVITIDLN